MMQERECRVIIESDEEIDGAFSCLFGEKETGTFVKVHLQYPLNFTMLYLYAYVSI